MAFNRFGTLNRVGNLVKHVAQVGTDQRNGDDGRNEAERRRARELVKQWKPKKKG